MKRLLSLVAVAALATACFSFSPLAYAPQPARISNPAAEAKSLILANTVQGCVAEPDVNETMLVVKFVCATGNGGVVGNTVVRFKNVQDISLGQSGKWYRVLVHQQGGDDFEWTSKNLEDMQRLADAIAALSHWSPSAKQAGTTPA